jgi:phosphohistidine phosphatase
MSGEETPRDLTLILVRHSQAEDPGTFAGTGSPDCDRPLTSQGVKRMKRAARGMRELIDGVDRILTSPCTRAEQTARILARELDHGTVERAAELAPGGDPAELTQWLAHTLSGGVVMLVGHEPDLSRLIAWLCADSATSLVEIKKGAACAVYFAGTPGKGRGTILWLMPQAQLRKL